MPKNYANGTYSIYDLTVLIIILFIFWYVVQFCVDTLFAPDLLAEFFYFIASKINVALICFFVGITAVIFVFSFFTYFMNKSNFISKTVMSVVCLVIFVGSISFGIIYNNPCWVELHSTNFSQQNVSITENTTIRFVNLSGASRRLCLAFHAQCAIVTHGPEELQQPGTTIEPSQTLHIRFPIAGDYGITVDGIPTMLLYVHVTVPATPKNDYHPEFNPPPMLPTPYVPPPSIR